MGCSIEKVSLRHERRVSRLAEDFVIEMLHITKEFPGIKANDDITLQLRKGEVHALLGENGAGKSTLMSVLFGLYQPEAGQIRKNGKEVVIRNPNDANALGIGMVHQHFKLVECFSVLDNIILGVEPNKLGFLQKAEARKKVMALSEKYGLRVDPDALVSDISVGMQQRVEIMKVLFRGADLLILDEPTAVLTDLEVEGLFDIMRSLTAEGKGIADQRIAIARGIKESIDTIKGSELSSQEANRLFEYTQWVSMMEAFAAKGSSSVVLPGDFDRAASFYEQQIAAGVTPNPMGGEK